MKKLTLSICILVLTGCQNFVDDQSGINGKIEKFVKNKLYPSDTIISYDFSRFLKGTNKKPVYYWLDYSFARKRQGKKEFLKYHFETDSLLNITYCKNITSPLRNSN